MSSWVDDVVAVFGEPRLAPRSSQGMLFKGDDGTFWRRSWVWFPRNVNHYVGIDRYNGEFYKVRIGCHHFYMPRIDGIWYPEDPTDDQMRDLIRLIRFLEPHTSPEGVLGTNGRTAT